MTEFDDFDDKPYRSPPLFTDDQVGMVLCFLTFCILSAISCFVFWMLPPDSRVGVLSAGAAIIIFILILLKS